MSRTCKHVKTKIVRVCSSTEEGKKGRCIMKKFILPLAVLLLATPAWATVAITIVDEGSGVARIDYNVTGEPNKVRAFALDVTVDSGATILEISDFLVGESIAPTLGYGIGPASFRDFVAVDPVTGEPDWSDPNYTILADPCDPGALGGLGTGGVTIEAGALYYPTGDTSPNAPGPSGTICKLKVDITCKMSIAENAIRGGIVLTDPAAAPTVDVATGATEVDITVGVAVCFPATPEYASQYADFMAYRDTGVDPDCWCSAYQCDGDADGATQGFKKERVMTNDLVILSANWKKLITDPTINPCADLDHKSQGFKKERVMTNDLAILVANWKKTDAQLAGDCPRPD